MPAATNISHKPQTESEPLPDLRVQDVNNKYFTEASPRARYRGLRVSTLPSPCRYENAQLSPSSF